MTDTVGKTLFKQGWEQGAYLFCKALSAEFHLHCWAGSKGFSENLQSHLTDSRNALILLSQSCDIVAPCEKEKTLEFVLARSLKKNKQPYFLNLDARSTRFLELELAENIWYKAEASRILQVSKQNFYDEITTQNLSPLSLTKIQQEVLARWRANRYMRVALPDSFMNQIQPLLAEGLFESGLEHAGSLYLNLEPFEESESYTVRLFALYRQNSPPETYDNLSNKMEQIIERVNAIDGLICPFLEEETNPLFQDILPAMRRDEVTIEQLDQFVRWNFDYVSLREDDSEGIDQEM
jgi:hypothetical protein